ncbi:mediator of DNA damage checkpoint protein 1 [Cololabis saira]|uniref:mediator of DNA damage checkpoint protein 1 n=1 Tax=Cololabis saira TaxID=129043 RepID=UPI002AD40456|nr:mediator of DNA damage checkpoint protein 1 [Cololabis saira]
MEATQVISDSILESDENENEEENQDRRGRALAKLCIFKNQHIPETELPLFLGDNVLGRDPGSCTLTLPAASVSKQHAAISISVYQRRGCHSEVEALVWDLGSMNGTRKGRLKLTPHVRYALTEGESLVVADIPCQYVSCGADPVSSQDGTRTPGSRSSAVKDVLPDASGEKLGDARTGNKEYVNGDIKARGSLKKTPVRGTYLSFEQTPIQAQGTLVPESDTDSDGERGEGEDKRRKALASDSDSHKSSPSSSSFLSPPNKTVPESEDESPITPSSSASKRSYRHVGFSTDKADVNVGRQQVEKKMSPAVIDDSSKEEDGAGQGGTNSKESRQHEKKDGSLTGENEQPVSASDIYRGAIPSFNMDSDTDVEGEDEEVAPGGPVCLNTNQQAAQPPNTVLFHMDSDTDVDEDEDNPNKADKTAPSSENTTKPSNIASVIQPEGSTMDSDTDVDEDDAVSGAATSVKATSCERAHAARSASSVQLRDFHLDSDTDVDEEDDGGCGPKNKNSETPIKSVLPESVSSAPHNLHLDGVADKEAIPAPPVSEPSVTAAVSELCSTAIAGNELDILSDSDTDMEGDSPPILPVGTPSLSAPLGTTPEEAKLDYDADTDVDECTIPNAGEEAFQTGCRGDIGADVEDKEAGEDLISDLHRENTPASLVPLLQNCSTPVQASVGLVEDMETQAFTSPSSGAFRRAAVFPVRPLVSSSCSDSQEEEDFVVAETQSFIFQSGDDQLGADSTQPYSFESSDNKMDEQCSGRDTFQLGLSDSSHLQGQARALDTESTQAFFSVEGDVNFELDTQAFAAISAAGVSSAGHDSNLGDTQVYDKEELARCSEVSEKQGSVDLAQEATQAYISEPFDDPDDNSDEVGENAASTEPADSIASSTLAVPETQPMTSFVGQNSLETSKPFCSMQAKSGAENEFMSETQPMHRSDDGKLFLDVQKKIENPQQLDEKQAQLPTRSATSLPETQPLNDDDENQPMVLCDNDQTEDEDLMFVLRKRKVKQLHIEEEETQCLTKSEVAIAETQPMAVSMDDDADSMPGPRKRKAKPLHFEDETQSQVSSEVSAVESQPVGTSQDAESDNECSFLGPRKRKAKQLHLEEEDTQRLTISEASATEIQPSTTFQDADSDSIPGLHQAVHNKEEQKQVLATEVSAADTNPVTTDKKDDDHSTPERQKRPAKQLNLKDKETQLKTPLKTKTAEMSGSSVTKETRTRSRKTENEKECSVPSDAQTERENTALPSTRGRRGRDRSDDNNEEETKQPKQTRGSKITRRQEDDGKTDQRKTYANKSLNKEQQEGEMDVMMLRQQERKETEKERQKSNDNDGEQEHQHKTEEEKLENTRETVQERQQNEDAERKTVEMKRVEEEHQAELDGAEGEKLEKVKETKEKQLKESQEDKEKVEQNVSVRGRRASKRTMTVQCRTEPKQDSTISSFEDFPASRTRSRSNSSNSVSSERSASSVTPQESRAKGRGRGGKRGGAETPQTSAVRTRRRITVAAGPSGQDSNDVPLSSSEVSSCGVSSQNRGRGGRQRGRGRKTEPGPNTSVPAFSESHQRRSRRNNNNAEVISGEVFNENGQEEADSQKAGTSRGQQQTNPHGSTPSIPSDKGQADQGQELAVLKSTPTQRNVRGKGQKLGKTESVETPAATAVGDGNQSRNTRKGRKSELQSNTRLGRTKVSKEEEGAHETIAAAEGAKDEPREDISATVQPKRSSRSSSAPAKKNAKEPLPEEVVQDGEKVEQGTVRKSSRGRASVVQRGKKESLEDSGTSETSTNQDANMEAPEQPQTPKSRVSRKRQAPADSPAAAKTPRSSSASPAASARIRAGNQAYKVLFTGVVDEDGEQVLARLGGSMAEGVADMNCLVTDKVRRTVKFLCAVAKGVPIVTTDWLEKSGKAGCFLSTHSFVVKDPEQETKFSFCLQESLKAANSQRLLQGYEIHVTKSVKPEPVHMKDIISSSGATFLPKMPTSQKPQTVVISCEEDLRLCGPALSASLPIVSAEFILTGILQQKRDFQTHALSPPVGKAQPAGGRARGRRKT